VNEYLAHSSRVDFGIPAQSYREHVSSVVSAAMANAEAVGRFYRGDREVLIEQVRLAAEFHDLGKLDDLNQEALACGSFAKLPVNHSDAGVAHLFSPPRLHHLAAWTVYSHHAGLPDFQYHRNSKPCQAFRDTEPILGSTTREIVNERLNEYLVRHESVFGCHPAQTGGPVTQHGRGLTPLALRIALSCLVDADHTDTARHYRKHVDIAIPDLDPQSRLALLDKYVEGLARGRRDDRTSMRTAVYYACREAGPESSLYECDSPVGSGKTTAIMAHLLDAACHTGLRRAFVVLPFTNIIDQSVDIYRKSLVCPGEDPESVVAAHHHRAEYESPELRTFAFSWSPPIVVVTAVQFFETMAAANPAALRKLHCLPGSAIFIDESHASLPWHLWPQAWRWLDELVQAWGCHLVLGSGTLTKFWTLPEFSEQTRALPNLLPRATHKAVHAYESSRVSYQSYPHRLDLPEFLEWAMGLPGPRIVVVNTVSSAAVVAGEVSQRSRRASVEHLSTALCPRDIKQTLARVKHRLADQSDTNWTLVATSCVEAGVELSFRTGLRERSSLTSIIQLGGRVNRDGKWPESTVWDFQLSHGGLLKENPSLRVAQEVLGRLFQDGTVGPMAATEAIRMELALDEMRPAADDIRRAEKALSFPAVADKFRVIEADTVTAIVDQALLDRLEAGGAVSPNDIQVLSVQVRRYLMREYGLDPIRALGSLRRYPEMYRWTLGYDDFQGYMAGVIQVFRHRRDGSIV
jgi:hypothetical protein